jgi:hypothetical protein
MEEFTEVAIGSQHMQAILLSREEVARRAKKLGVA